MQPRVLEPELMDDLAHAEAYALADFDEVNESFVRSFCDRFPDFRAGRVVELGCGPGDIPIRLARRLPDIDITAVDGAKEMLTFAERAVAAAGLTTRVRLEQVRLPAGPALLGRFDAIVSNSLLHHLADPSILWTSIRELAKPRSPVLVMDLMRPETRREAEQIVGRHAFKERETLRVDFLNSLLAAFTKEEVDQQLDAAGLAKKLVVEVVSDRHLMISGLL